MTTVPRQIKVQVGANAPIQSVRADGNLATRVGTLAKHGWTKGDTDKLIRSPQLNDRSPIPGSDAYGNKSEGAVIRPLMAAADDRRVKVSIDGQHIKFTTAASAKYFTSQIGKFFATKGKGSAQTAPSRPSRPSRPTTPAPVTPAPTTPAAPSGKSISDVQAANKAIVALIAQAATQEPVSDSRNRWTTEMRSVVTFGVEGSRGKGSLERFVEANNLGSGIKDVLIQAAKYGAHSSQGSSAGVLAFVPNARNLANLEKKLNALYSRRDVNNDGIMTKAEVAKAKETANGKALFTGRRLSQLAKMDTTQDFRSELEFSQKANHAINLFYSAGSISGSRHVERLANRFEANGQDAEAEAVRAIYSSVSMYLSSGRTTRQSFICRDQRREVTRGVMRVFGASADRTERAINALDI